MQTLLALLTALAILICPYICAVKEAMSRAAGIPLAKACCSHCESKQHSSNQQSDAPEKSPEQDTRTCVCAGAICSTVDRLEIDIAAQADAWVCQLDPVVVPDCLNSLNSVDPAGLPPPWQALQRRIALRSLLI